MQLEQLDPARNETVQLDPAGDETAQLDLI